MLPMPSPEPIPPLSELTDEVIHIAARAAERILQVYNSSFSVVHKDDKTPLTEADMASHHCICDYLTRLTPNIPVLTEESTSVSFETRKSWEYYWLIDPLDGTREFIKQNGEFTVNIALIHAHKPVIGVINVPVTGKTYYASQGNGAFVRVPGEPARQIQTRQTRKDAIKVAGSRSHGSKKLHALIGKLGDVELLSIGSSLKFCLVAEGVVDIYPRFGPTSEWDTAAAQCIVEEAGGAVMDMSMNSLTYNMKAELLNPHFIAIADPAFDWSSFL
jgi:3'(2'), 5'-bisphosphate nucleotidase